MLIIFKIYTNNTKKAIIKANNAIASVKANPKIAALNNSSFNEGFLAIPATSDENINPIPIPAPANPKVDKPAPIFCAANNIYYFLYNIILLLTHSGKEFLIKSFNLIYLF